MIGMAKTLFGYLIPMKLIVISIETYATINNEKKKFV
jgi:hypothetical protein